MDNKSFYSDNNVYANVNARPVGNNSATGRAYVNNEVRCPGKEITCMVLGIFSLVYGGFAALFFWHIVIGIIFGILGIGLGIPAIVLHGSVMKTATVTTKKVQVGKKLGIAGIICGAVAMVIAILFFVVVVGILGASILSEL